MSYRLLFGQAHASRRRIEASLRKLKAESPRHYDPFLDMVCTEPGDLLVQSKLGSYPSLWPTSCRTFEGELLQENSTYSSEDDFPMLGQRLVGLQEFNLRQQPSQLRDLWRDRRNPLQWYTFWAVLVVGGLSLLIGILQLAVAIAQLATQDKGGDKHSN